MLRSRGSASIGQRNSTSSPVPLGAADPSESKNTGKRKNQNRCFLLFQAVLVLGVCCYGIKTLFDKDKLNRQLMVQAEEWKAKLNKVTRELAEKEEHAQVTLLASEEKWNAKLEEAKKSNERLLQKQSQGKKDNTNDQEKKLKRQIESLRSSALRTQQQLQKLDKQAVLDKCVACINYLCNDIRSVLMLYFSIFPYYLFIHFLFCKHLPFLLADSDLVRTGLRLNSTFLRIRPCPNFPLHLPNLSSSLPQWI